MREARVAGTVSAGGTAAGRDGHRRGAGLLRPPGPALAHRREAAAGRGPRGLPAFAAAAGRAWWTSSRCEDAQRVNNLSRAYRVNLAVLALVALFTGAFLVYSVLSLSVARRAQQFALLGRAGPHRGPAAAPGAGRVAGAGPGRQRAGHRAGHGAGGAGAAHAGRRPGRRLLLRRRAASCSGAAPPPWSTPLLGTVAAGAGGWLPARAAAAVAAGADPQGPGHGRAARAAARPGPGC